ncbi:hypothetical protein J6590_005578 [Homalodisca vitripennis]|nr:hypothetical protein J6590_005578 [Homalodisca vitripennis]
MSEMKPTPLEILVFSIITRQDPVRKCAITQSQHIIGEEVDYDHNTFTVRTGKRRWSRASSRIRVTHQECDVLYRQFIPHHLISSTI